MLTHTPIPPEVRTGTACQLAFEAARGRIDFNDVVLRLEVGEQINEELSRGANRFQRSYSCCQDSATICTYITGELNESNA